MEALQKAKELGIENAETLTPKQLEKAIAAAEKAAAKLVKLQATAAELGMDHEGVSAEDLQNAINEEEAALAAKLEDEQKFKLIAEYVELSEDELNAISLKGLAKHLAAKKLVQEHSKETLDVEDEGKTDKTFAAGNKKKYQFAGNAPAAFRFGGVVKTQSEWIEDKDAMEIMVQGNLSYLKIVKK